MAFEGLSTNDGTIFLGHSQTLDSFRIVFQGASIGSAVETFKDKDKDKDKDTVFLGSKDVGPLSHRRGVEVAYYAKA